MSRIRPKERDAMIQSLRAGVVPRVGQHLIQVGRTKEIESMLNDIQRIGDNGAAIRFVIGDYGSGKTFFLNLIRAIALEKRLVTVHADLTPEKRLHSTGGHARSLYSELMQSLATRSKPEGGALSSVVERFVTEALKASRAKGTNPEIIIYEKLDSLTEMTGGYDFAQVIAAYWRGHDTGNEQLKSDAVRWLRAEFTTKTDARKALGVRTIIDDESFYDSLKLLARFVRLSGFSGLLICLDEMVNLYKMTNTRARNSNYEQILRIFNDCLQGSPVGMGVLMGGTPDFLMNTQRGLYSYGALQSRLAENTYAAKGYTDLTGPVLRLMSLTQEDFFVLIGKIRHVFAHGKEEAYLLPDNGLKAFMDHCYKRIGESYFRTPRTTIKSFVDLLSILDQNKDVCWTKLLDGVEVCKDTDSDTETLNDTVGADASKETSSDDDEEDDLAKFRL